jgi:hypothetical protein
MPPSRDFAVMHSSSVPNWRTEATLYAALFKEFRFVTDAAASAANTLAGRYFGPDQKVPSLRDALAIPDWRAPGPTFPWSGGPIFCNPPSSKEAGIALEPWLAKFVEQAALGATIVAVVPHKTSVAWWRHVRQAQEIREIPHRVKFWLPEEELVVINAARKEAGKSALKSGDSAGFDSAVVIFRPQPGVLQPATPRVVTWSYR